MRRGLIIGGLVVAGIVGWAAVTVGPSIMGAMGLRSPVIDTVPPELPGGFDSAPLRILLFSKTSGFRHEEAIAAASVSVHAIATGRGWAVFETENAAVFNDAQLAQFDVVFGNNITGDNWTEDQKAAFARFIEAGGGFVGVHGAAGTRYRYWDWYTDVLLGGGRFVGHPMNPQFQEAVVVVEDPGHPAMAPWGERFRHTDEWYSFEKSAREAGSHVLATLDESTYAPEAWGSDLRMGADHPIIWTACPGAGRSFYSALGHEAATYGMPQHADMLEAAIAWAADRATPCGTRVN